MTTRAIKKPSGDIAWMSSAKCGPVHHDLFFPVGTGETALEQEQRAKAVCADCPCRVECLEYALVNRIDHGVWGGCTEAERRRILKKRKAVG